MKLSCRPLSKKLITVETAIFEENIKKYANWKEDKIVLAKISHWFSASAKYQTEAESISKVKAAKHQMMQALYIAKVTMNDVKKDKSTLKLLMLSAILLSRRLEGEETLKYPLCLSAPVRKSLI